MDWQLRNGDSELKRRRANQDDGPLPIVDLIEGAVNRPPIVLDATERTPKRVSLNDLEITHGKLQAAVDAARKWADKKRNGYNDISLVLMGPYGVGKTHIARAILWSMIQAAVDDDGSVIAGTERPVGRFYTGNELVQRLDANTYASSLVGNAPLVVIDDVGAEQRVDYAGNDEAQLREKQSRYFKLINHCYDFQVSLVLTTNLNVPALKECLGGRAWSRLAQMAPAGFMVDMSGVPDYRLKASGR